LDRNTSLFVAVIFILVVSSASLSILSKKGFIAASNEPLPKLLRQSEIETFATDFVVAEGKVFVAADLWLFVYG
jgi:hypothetical protein